MNCSPEPRKNKMFKIVIFLLLSFSISLMAANDGDSMLDNEFSESANSLKGKIYAQYKKTLKSNPGTKGKVVFNITIDSVGELSSCKTYKSELQAPILEGKICNILQGKSYKTFSVKTAKVKYKLEFYSI